MLVTTRGIVLRNIKYGETSVISNIFTEELGMQAYIIKGIRSSRSKRNMGSLHALSLHNLIVYNKKNADINYLSEFKPAVNLFSLTGDIRKSTTAVFLAEVLYKSIRDHSQDTDLFEFAFNSIEMFDALDEKYSNFHLQFMLKLTKYLGFGLENGVFENFDSEGKIISELLEKPYQNDVELGNDKRRIILRDIIGFYKKHIDGFGNLRSMEILKEVFM